MKRQSIQSIMLLMEIVILCNDLMIYLKEYLSEFDAEISSVEVIYGPNRVGDVPHSHASVNKAKELLNYNPQFSLQKGLKEAVSWYWKNL